MAITLEQAKEIVEWIGDNLGSWDIEIRPEYSGRAMFWNQSTVAFVGPGPLTPAVAYAAASLGFDYEVVPQRLDNMGRGEVLY